MLVSMVRTNPLTWKKGASPKDYPLLSSLIGEIENPEILFLTTLLHDIGKGTDGDHSLVGQEMVKQKFQKLNRRGRERIRRAGAEGRKDSP